MAATNNITSMEMFRNYILRVLGEPVINVEVSHEQIDQIIYDSMDDFSRYNYGEGSYKTYMALSLSAGVDEYSLSGYNIQDIYDFSLSFGADGINTMFTPTHSILYEDWVVKGNYPGGSGGVPPGMVLTEWDVDMNYLEEVKRKFAREYHTDWRPAQQKLIVTPTPNEAVTGVLLMYKKEVAVGIYNNPLLKKLCVARTKKLWGSILNKNTLQLPGGGSLNGGEIKQEAIDEEKEIIEDIKKESEPINFFIG